MTIAFLGIDQFLTSPRRYEMPCVDETCRWFEQNDDVSGGRRATLQTPFSNLLYKAPVTFPGYFPLPLAMVLRRWRIAQDVSWQWW